MKAIKCKINGCQNKGHIVNGRQYFYKGYCNAHYQRMLRHGSEEAKHKYGVGRKNHPLYELYHKMRQRCTNPKAVQYKHYGGRGIKVCERWLGLDGFDYFVADVGPRPEGTTLDRKDNDGNYEPGNVRWATKSEQNSNRRKITS